MVAFPAQESGLELARITRKETRTEPNKQAEVLIKMQEIIGSDIVFPSAVDPVLYAEAAGDDLGLAEREVIDRVPETTYHSWRISPH